jgi:hypothetical protein
MTIQRVRRRPKTTESGLPPVMAGLVPRLSGSLFSCKVRY